MIAVWTADRDRLVEQSLEGREIESSGLRSVKQFISDLFQLLRGFSPTDRSARLRQAGTQPNVYYRFLPLYQIGGGTD
jgi:hypothetical protein